uniref:Uncharacterized protein n=2 Tax=Babesia bovis TaxID=5865 RepID=A7AMW0_BABBO|eukprot:XP_001611462.1 hypothetical protein [Babesia bovis T2Bo]
MDSSHGQELIRALSDLYDPLLECANLQEICISASGKGNVYRIAELYDFFDLSSVDITCRKDVERIIEADFMRSLDLLGSVVSLELHLYEIYPLLRRLLIIIEGSLLHVDIKKDCSFRMSDYRMQSFIELPLFTIFDKHYDRVFSRDIQSDILCSALSCMSKSSFFRIDNLLSNTSKLVAVLLPIVRHIFEFKTADKLEYALGSFTFGAFQRIAGLFLVLQVVDPMFGKSCIGSAKVADTAGNKFGTAVFDENLVRLSSLIKDTLHVPLGMRVSSDFLCLLWEDFLVIPIFRMFESMFLYSNKIIATHGPLVDLVIDGVANFMRKVLNDYDPSHICQDVVVKFTKRFLSIFHFGTVQVNKCLSSYFFSRLSHMIKLRQNYSSHGPGVNNRGYVHNVDPLLDGLVSPRPVTFSINALVGEGTLKNTLSEYVGTMTFYSHHVDDLFYVMFGIYALDASYTLIEHLSLIYIHFAGLVELTDVLGYVTQLSPNVEIASLLQKGVGVMWSILKSMSSHMSFEAFKTCFYHMGSEFHSCNVAAQIVSFNSLDWSLERLEMGYLRSEPHYITRVEMLQSILKNASRYACTCIAYATPKHRRPLNSYSTISHISLSKWLIMELRAHKLEKRGLLDALTEWCTSYRAEEYILAQYLCRVVAMLHKADESLVACTRYLFDVLIGICMNTDGSMGLSTVMGDMNPGKKNLFRCIGTILRHSLISSWFMRNVMLPLTCVFINEVRKHTSFLESANHQLPECYFVSNNKECRCYRALIVGKSKSFLSYIELLSHVRFNQYTPVKDDEMSNITSYVINVLSTLEIDLIQSLYISGECGTLEDRFSVFVLAIRLGGALVKVSNFGQKDAEVVSILKLFSMLSNPSICVALDVKVYLSIIENAIRICHTIYTDVPVKEQLLKLQRIFITLLFTKMDTNPVVLLKHDLYKHVPSEMLGQLTANFPNILQKARGLGYYFTILYNYRIWHAMRRYNIHSAVVKKEYIDSTLCTQGESPEVRITLNVAFISFSRISDIQKAETIHEFVRKGSSIGMYTNQ